MSAPSPQPADEVLDNLTPQQQAALDELVGEALAEAIIMLVELDVPGAPGTAPDNAFPGPPTPRRHERGRLRQRGRRRLTPSSATAPRNHPEHQEAPHEHPST